MTIVELDARRPKEATVKVSEIFGPTLQGEGPSAGQPCSFVRLGLCNLDCNWCDTPHTWDWKGKNGVAYDRKVELSTMTVSDVVVEVEEVAGYPMLVVISGGEPLVQESGLDALVEELLDTGVATRIEIETNGTRRPSGLLQDLSYRDGPVRFNVSPKLSGSGVDPRTAIVPEVLEVFAQLQACFKFVVSSPKEIAEVAAMHDMLGVPGSDIWLMPEGRTMSDITARFGAVFDAAIHNGWSCSTRLHVLAHNDERGI